MRSATTISRLMPRAGAASWSPTRRMYSRKPPRISRGRYYLRPHAGSPKAMTWFRTAAGPAGARRSCWGARLWENPGHHRHGPDRTGGRAARRGLQDADRVLLAIAMARVAGGMARAAARRGLGR